MKQKGKKRLANLVKVGLALVSVLGTMVLSNLSVAKAEDLIHTHIWATKYDTEKHWEYCTVCAKTRNVTTHKCVDHWELGYESCHRSNGNNFSTRICECGYSYKYTKPHTEIDKWNSTGVRMIHYKKCSACNDWTRSGRCANEKGYLSCQNIGTCTSCGFTSNANCHYLVSGGKCRDCGKVFFSYTQPTITYDKDYKTATIKFRFSIVDSSVQLTGIMGAYCGNPNYSTQKWTYNKNNDGSLDYTGVYTFDPTKQRKSTLSFLDRTGAIKINGANVYTDASFFKPVIWQDHTAPVVTEVKQVNQALHNTWATIKELTISGTENLSKIVTISIIDKASGDVIVKEAKTAVNNGKYSYKCTPPLEGPESGRAFIARVVDEVGNQVDKEFIIYKTDCRAPLIRSGKEYTTWSKTKNLELELTDYGSGSPASSLNNQTSHITAKTVNGKYYACYSFAEDKYDVTEYKIYLKDGLGNAGVDTIKVGRVDNTKPTIVDIKGEVKEMEEMIDDGATTLPTPTVAATAPAATIKPTQKPANKYASITVTANDMNTKLNKEGSGVVAYALTNSKNNPTAEQWQKANVVEAFKKGTYYLWVKDGAGNIADLKIITVKDDMSIVVSDKEIEVNEPVDDKYSGPNDGKDSKVSKDDESKRDATPKTADESIIYIAAALLLVSCIVMMFVSVRKRRLNRY